MVWACARTSVWEKHNDNKFIHQIKYYENTFLKLTKELVLSWLSLQTNEC